VLALALSTGSIFAADLGGSCCAELEERIAELEVTTATQGNRKVSLTISGQVNRIIMWWDDGHSSNNYYGLESTNFTSRFDFTGKARVTQKVNAGFQLTIDSRAGGYSGGVSQLDEDGKFSAFIPNVNRYRADWSPLVQRAHFGLLLRKWATHLLVDRARGYWTTFRRSTRTPFIEAMKRAISRGCALFTPMGSRANASHVPPTPRP